jgi:O-antigen/teichoic acid export membrane protein
MSFDKLILKNSIINSIQICITILLSVYLSRIVLKLLGVIDYGIFNIVGGVMAMLVFINTAMSVSTQRYLSTYLGKKDMERVRETYRAGVILHRYIAVVCVLLVETIGVYFIKKVIVIPADRMNAASWVLHCSIASFCLSILTVPNQALLLSKEDALPVALFTLLGNIAQIIGVIVLSYRGGDRLIGYSIVLVITNALLFTLYQGAVRIRCKDITIRSSTSNSQIKEMLGFAGWNTAGAFSVVVKNQGVSIVLNTFLGPVINAALGISNQINSALIQVSQSIVKATNPRLIKLYSNNEMDRVNELMNTSIKLSCFIQMLVLLPLLIKTDLVLSIWLDTVPVYSVRVCRIILLNIFIETMSYPLMTIVQASGKIRTYQIVNSILYSINIPLSYIVMKMTDDVGYALYVMIFVSAIGLCVRLAYAKRLSGYQIIAFVTKVLTPLVSVFLGCYLLVNAVSRYFDNNFGGFALIMVVTWGSLFLLSCFLLLSGIKRTALLNKLVSLVNRRRRNGTDK